MIRMNTLSCSNSGKLFVVTLRRSLGGAAMAAMLLLATSTHADAAGRVESIGSTAVDCDRPEWQSVREPAASPRGAARAHWLSAGLIRWPGADLAGRYRLLHSARGQITAAIGARATGEIGRAHV